jgi:hypothetical protein
LRETVSSAGKGSTSESAIGSTRVAEGGKKGAIEGEGGATETDDEAGDVKCVMAFEDPGGVGGKGYSKRVKLVANGVPTIFVEGE